MRLNRKSIKTLLFTLMLSFFFTLAYSQNAGAGSGTGGSGSGPTGSSKTGGSSGASSGISGGGQNSGGSSGAGGSGQSNGGSSGGGSSSGAGSGSSTGGSATGGSSTGGNSSGDSSQTGGNQTGSGDGTGTGNGTGAGTGNGTGTGENSGSENSSGESGTEGGNSTDKNDEDNKKNKSITTGADAIAAVQNGTSLSYVTTEALKEGIATCGDNESMSEIKGAMETELRLREVLGDAKEKALEAEDLAAECMKDYQEQLAALQNLEKQLQEQIDSLRGKNGLSYPLPTYEKAKKDVEELAETKKLVDEQKKKVEEAKKELDESISKMEDAYQELADAYNEAGDPVRLANGKYVAKYVDYEAIDNLSHFKITRNLDYDGCVESFGQNWTCSLDSRIAFCLCPDFDELTDKIIEILDLAEDESKTLNLTYAYFPDYKNEELDEKIDEIASYIKDYKILKEYYKYFTLQYAVAAVSSRFVMYGKFLKMANMFGNGDMIEYIDDTGRIRTFKYSPDYGYWEPLDEFSKKNIKIFGRNRKNEINTEGSVVKGFVVQYSDGKSKYYSHAGYLEKEVDRNGNEIIYSVNDNGRVNEVLLATGETLTIERNDSELITAVKGSYSGTTYYTYDDNALTSVTDNNGLKVTYSYDSDGDLTKIGKADGNQVQIIYSNNSEKGKVCSAIINENGDKETFSYSKNRTVNHKTIMGLTEYYEINADGNTIYYKDGKGGSTIIQTNQNGTIKKITDIFDRVEFFYDDDFRVIRKSHKSGAEENFVYNPSGNLEKQTDGDGFSRTYAYDKNGNVIRIYYCGNLITSCQYNSKGLISELNEDNNIYTYKYNPYGQIVEKNTRYSDGKILRETWSYNSRGREIKYTSSSGITVNYSYEVSGNRIVSKTENHGYKTVTHYYDVRNREYKTVIKDVKNNVSYTKRVVYDGMGNIKKMYLNEVLFSEYEYEKDGKLKSYIVWNNLSGNTKTLAQGIKTSYQFDSSGYMINEKRTPLKKSADGKKIQMISDDEKIVRAMIYEKDGGKLIVYEYAGGDKNSKPDKYYYNERGQLYKIVKKDGYEILFEFSIGGRLLKESDSNNYVYTYKYLSNGNVEIIEKNPSGNEAKYIQNEKGKLISAQIYDKTRIDCSYDAKGNLIRKEKADSFISYSYDDRNRLVSKSLRDKSGKIFLSSQFTYNDSNRSEKEKKSNGFEFTRYYDAWNRLIKETDRNGTTTYTYDILGNLVKRISPDGTEYNYEYAPFGQLTYASSGKGENLYIKYDVIGNCLRQEKNGRLLSESEYDVRNNLIRFVNELGAETRYEYNAQNILNLIDKYDTGHFTYKKLSGNKLQVSSEDGNILSYEIGEYGKTVGLSDVYGNKEIYKYDVMGRLLYKKDFGGIEERHDYQAENHRENITFSSGDYLKISKNILDQITQLENKDYTNSFEYDAQGNLIKNSDNLRRTVNYSYDKSGRCVNKYSDYFNFNYYFDDHGNVKQIIEKKSNEQISFTYDEWNREIKRVFSKGITVSTGYSGDFKIYEIYTNKNGLVLNADFILYDSSGKINLQCNAQGELTKYEYDAAGRLIKVKRAYTNAVCEFYRTEAIENGLFIKNEHPEGQYLTLTASEKKSLNAIINKTSLKNCIHISQSQYSWFEEYEYTESGSIKSIKNPFGKTVYEYDKMNRLVKKYGASSKNNGWQFQWSKGGNLIKAENKYNRFSFSYNGLNQLIYFTEENIQTGDLNWIEYKYDGAGRLAGETIQDKVQFEYVYDRLTNQVLYKYPAAFNKQNMGIYKKNFSNIDQNYSYRESQKSDGENTETDFRTFSADVNPYDDAKQYFEQASERTDESLQSFEKQLSNITQTKETINYEPVIFLNGNGKLLEKIVENNFSGSNGQKNLVLMHDLRGNLVGAINTDGVYEKTELDEWGNPFTSGENFSFNKGQPLTNGKFVIYNLGNRLYSPVMKSFLSMDPARKDGNWYAYCAADPVNYGDFNGLYKSNTSPSQDAEYTSSIAGFMRFNGDDQKENGEEMGIPLPYDCADTTAVIDNLCAQDAGMDNYSPMAEKFDSDYSNGKYDDARGDTQSNDYWDGDGTNTTLISDDVNDLQDADLTTPGTVIVTAPDPDSGVRTGHTIIIIARDFDEDGNIIGLVYLEGHMGDKKSAEVGYMYVNGQYEGYKNLWNIRSWRGKYSGSYELEGRESDKKGEKREPNYRCEQ